MQVNVLKAKTNLSQLIEAAERGEEVIIARAGQPAVRLVAVRPVDRRDSDPALLRASLVATGLVVRLSTVDGEASGGRGTATMEEILADLNASREER